MATYSESMDHYANMRKGGMKARKGDPAIDHLRISKTENAGHIVEHHVIDNGMNPLHKPKQYTFPAHEDGQPKPKLPEGHVLQHIAKHMNIPHEVIKLSETHGRQSQEPEMEETAHPSVED